MHVRMTFHKTFQDRLNISQLELHGLPFHLSASFSDLIVEASQYD